MTYQNVWALSPKPAVRGAVIGKSVVFPVLLQYPEDKSLVSLAVKSTFQVAYLSQLPNVALLQPEVINLISQMYAELSVHGSKP